MWTRKLEGIAGSLYSVRSNAPGISFPVIFRPNAFLRFFFLGDMEINLLNEPRRRKNLTFLEREKRKWDFLRWHPSLPLCEGPRSICVEISFTYPELSWKSATFQVGKLTLLVDLSAFFHPIDSSASRPFPIRLHIGLGQISDSTPVLERPSLDHCQHLAYWSNRVMGGRGGRNDHLSAAAVSPRTWLASGSLSNPANALVPATLILSGGLEGMTCLFPQILTVTNGRILIRQLSFKFLRRSMFLLFLIGVYAACKFVGKTYRLIFSALLMIEHAKSHSTRYSRY